MAKISTSEIHFPAAGKEGSGFLASPTEGSYPGVVVIQEWWGLNDHIKDITQRLANEGFVALAADLYDGRVTKDPQQAQSMLLALDKEVALNKLSGAVNALKGNPKVAAGRVGVIGFCMGGFYSLMLASRNKDVRAATPFYGHVPPDAVLAGLTAPVFYVYAGKDQHIPGEEAGRLEQFLQRSGNPGQVKRYPNADHAFVNDTRTEVYKADDAKDAWAQAVAFLKKHLGE
jgi:carboxymethylenebutenolidase